MVTKLISGGGFGFFPGSRSSGAAAKEAKNVFGAIGAGIGAAQGAAAAGAEAVGAIVDAGSAAAGAVGAGVEAAETIAAAPINVAVAGAQDLIGGAQGAITDFIGGRQFPGGVRPPVFTGPITPGFLPPGIFRPPVFGAVKAATELAESAIDMLNSAQPTTLNAALSTVKAKRIAGNKLIEYLERRVRVGEVLQKLASHWTQDTKQDFAAAFQMGVDKLAEMDIIVAISILTDPELDDEIRAENLSESTDQDLMADKRIVWQHPPAGSVLEPPYMILIAVEHRDVAEAERAVDAILNQLTTVDGYRVTKTSARHLRSPLRQPIRGPATRS